MCLSLHTRINAFLIVCWERENAIRYFYIEKNISFFQAKNMLYKKNLEFDPVPLALKMVRKISWKIRTFCLCFEMIHVFHLLAIAMQ